MPNDPYPLPHPLLMLVRGLVRRCPRCGGGRLFRSWLRMLERCPRCGIRFERDEGYFLGAFVVNFGVVLIALAAFIIAGMAVTLPDPPPGKLALMGALLCVVVPIGFYPFSRTVWSAIDLWLTPLDPREIEAAGDATPPAP